MTSSWDLLIFNVLYPTSDDFAHWSRGDLAIEGKTIVEVGPDLPRVARKIFDGSSLVVFPGLFNMHTHSYDMFWRGSREGAGIDRTWPNWFLEAYDSVGINDWIAAARATYIYSLRGGVTYLVDHLRRNFSATPFIDALGQVGLKGRVHAVQIEDQPGPLVVLHETSPWFEASLEQAARLPRLPTMLHAQETAYRLEHVYRRTGRSTVELLDDYGLLDSQTFLVHLCEHSASDLQRIAERGAYVVVTPVAEMKLGERTLSPEVVRKYGINLLLGTDGPAYHNNDDLFDDVRLMALLWAREHGPEAVCLEDLLAAVTWRAAEAAARDAGRIRAGSCADLILLDVGNLSFQPLVREPFDNIATQIVYCATRAEVLHVIVDGRIVVENGKCLTMDEFETLGAMKGFVRGRFELY